MKKALIISYYWPPSGGAGVQRWLKLSKYLAKLGVEVHVLTVNPKIASYTTKDASLNKDIHNKVTVHTSDSFEIINYYSKLVGKKNVPTAGFSNVDNKSLLQKTANSIRSNFFIPDPRIGWKKYAVKKANEIITKYEIKTVITTSPPHSTQLIGFDLKKKLAINWIVDFRDPWTDIYYYEILGHSNLSKRIDKRLEKKVIENCDKIITVSSGFKSIFLSKAESILEKKIHIIPNGYDPEDFEFISKKVNNQDTFTICYTGTMSDQYNPEIFFEALNKVRLDVLKIKFQIIGTISESLKVLLTTMEYEVEFISTVPHEEVVKFQSRADLLLLVIPDIKLAAGITPGKLFEYMATENQILAIGPKESDVNSILLKCGSGKTFGRSDIIEIVDFINELILAKSDNHMLTVDSEKIQEFSRLKQAEEIANLIL